MTTPDNNTTTYAQRIDMLRFWVAGLSVFGVMAGIICVALGAMHIGYLFVWLAGLWIVAALGFTVEFMIRMWSLARGKERAGFQFSISGLLILMSVVAVVAGMARVLSPLVFFFAAVHVVVFFILIACTMESPYRARARKEENRKPGLALWQLLLITTIGGIFCAQVYAAHFAMR